MRIYIITFGFVLLFLYFTKHDLLYKYNARKGKKDYDYRALFVLTLIISIPLAMMGDFLHII